MFMIYTNKDFMGCFIVREIGNVPKELGGITYG